MIKNRRRVYAGVLDIPEQRIGDFSIVHEHMPARTTLQFASSRTALFGGDKGSVTFTEPTRWHKLLEHSEKSHALWMTDLPIEQYQHDKLLTKFRGTVLVGGLGLGYAVTALAHRTAVKEIVVVENAPEVVSLVAEHTLKNHPELRQKVTFVCADLFDYLKTTTKKFTFGFYDIWASDGEHTFFHTVCPLRELSWGKVGRIVCWNENIMRGQLFFGLQGRIWASATDKEKLEVLCDSTDPSIWIQWSQPFFKWFRKAQPDERITNMAIQTYVNAYGTSKGWLKRWRQLFDHASTV